MIQYFSKNVFILGQQPETNYMISTCLTRLFIQKKNRQMTTTNWHKADDELQRIDEKNTQVQLSRYSYLFTFMFILASFHYTTKKTIQNKMCSRISTLECMALRYPLECANSFSANLLKSMMNFLILKNQSNSNSYRSVQFLWDTYAEHCWICFVFAYQHRNSFLDHFIHCKLNHQKHSDSLNMLEHIQSAKSLKT